MSNNKTIVTHLNPDLDAMTSVWLIKRFMPDWEDAEVKFIPAGMTEIKDEDNVLVVDTGFGPLDHHQTDKRTCAAKLVWEHIGAKNEAVDRLVSVVLRIDFSAEDITMPDASDDFYAFLFNERQIIRGIRSLYRGQSGKQLEIGMQILDSVLEVLKMKIEAEDVIEQGVKFKTRWGNGVGAETKNEMYMHLAQELGFVVVVAKDPKKGHIRIHALPQKGFDFTKEYEEFKKRDTDATWYLHTSKSLLLNGSTANPDMKPTKLTLSEVIGVLRKL